MVRGNGIVVADSCRARFFHSIPDEPGWAEGAGLSHVASRIRSRDLVSDGSGSTFDSHGTGRHHLEPKITAQAQEAVVFAREIAEHLRRDKAMSACRKLALVAPPHFLGLLRKSFDRNVLDKVACEVDKSVVGQSIEQIRELLPRRWP